MFIDVVMSTYCLRITSSPPQDVSGSAFTSRDFRIIRTSFCFMQNETNGLKVLWEENRDLKVLPEGQRIALLTVAIVLCSLCVVGNCAAIFTVMRRYV
jgi:hypothetical protein